MPEERFIRPAPTTPAITIFDCDIYGHTFTLTPPLMCVWCGVDEESRSQ